MAITINAQFNKFVQFAQQQPNAATSTAIARVTGSEDPLAGPLRGRAREHREGRGVGADRPEPLAVPQLRCDHRGREGS